MDEADDMIGTTDSGRYENDFEKLPRDEEEVQAAAEPVAEQGSPGGDAKNMETETTCDEPAPSVSKSQLNVEEAPAEMPSAETSTFEGNEVAVCTSCKS